jgi:hypothetical protein
LLDGTGKPIDATITVDGNPPVVNPTILGGGEVVPGQPAGSPALLAFKTVREVDFHTLGIGLTTDTGPHL